MSEATAFAPPPSEISFNFQTSQPPTEFVTQPDLEQTIIEYDFLSPDERLRLKEQREEARLFQWAEHEASQIDLGEDSEDSIFHKYSLQYEIDFLRKVTELPKEERQFYIKENIFRFLGEFVGKVPYTKISYFLKDGEMQYGNMGVSSSYQKAVDIAGVGSREYYENEGYKKIRDGLNSPDKDIAYWLSPPKIADYSFGMVWLKNYDAKLKLHRIDEYLLRYPEAMGQTKRSQEILAGIDPSLQYKTTQDFLNNPILAKTTNADQDLSAMLNLVGINNQDVAASRMFMSSLERDLPGAARQYGILAIRLSEMNPEDPKYKTYEKAMKVLLAGMWNIAEENKKAQEAVPAGATYHFEGTDEPATSRNSQADSLLLMAIAARDRAAETNVLSDCEATKPGSGNDLYSNSPQFVSSAEILTAISQGRTIEAILSGRSLDYHEPYKCPGCSSMLSGEHKYDKSQWRKECEHCHYKFNCDQAN